MFRQALEVYLDPESYPVLVHCTQGKDRSGLIIMIVLFILRVPVELVKADYVLSNQGLDRIRASMLKEVLEIGMDERYMQAPGEVVDEVWRFLEERGGVEAYLDEIGFGEKKRRILRDLLLE
jgi:protein-tyrosine phosphatase